MRIAKDPQAGRPAPARTRPTTGPTAGPTTSPIAARAAQSPAVHRLRSLQRRAKPPQNAPIQRVLAHTAPIAGVDVVSVTALAPKVFLLSGAQGDSVIIKIEIAGGGETPDSFSTRDAYTRELANLVLTGVPNAQAVTPGDLAQIGGLAAPPVTGDLADLQRALAPPLPPNFLVLKAQQVNVGLNVQAEMDAAAAQIKKGGRSLKKGMGKITALQTALSQPAMVRSLGQMAAFDMTVNNYDRFRPAGTVNLVNLDIGAATALGIDNLDPWNQLVAGAWAGGAPLAGPGPMLQYATNIVQFLQDQIGMEGANLHALTQHFMLGMVTAMRALKAHEANIRADIAAENNQDKINVMTILADRLQQLPNV